MSLESLIPKSQVIAVVCNQWGDTGKGMVVDTLSEYVDVIARGTGGNNAGHTTILNGKKRIFHLVPSGILYDTEGKINVLGNGMVIDLNVLCSELNELDKEGLPYENLMISQDAHVIMPYHIARDRASDQSQAGGGIGSTGRGIGPCYTDKIARRGVMIRDLYDKDTLVSKIKKAAKIYPEQKIDAEQIIEVLKNGAERIKPFVRDTITEMHEFLRHGRRILLEGAQGLLLSVEYGTYPYVTSSDCSVNGTAAGVGISARDVGLTLGVVKFPFMTRVGAGPFPTELGGEESEKWCAESGRTVLTELNHFGIPYTLEDGQPKYDYHDAEILRMINSDNPFLQGVGVRLAAGEYGATTGRPRRTGWTDAVAVKYAVGINGQHMILTKANCLDGCDKFKVCYDYYYKGDKRNDFNRDAKFLREVKVSYGTYRGYGGVGEVSSYDDLPSSLKRAIFDFENFTKGEVVALSTGAERGRLISK